MKRLGIFVFFNERGKVAQYVEILLKGICEVADQLLIVVNGMIVEEEKAKLKRYSDYIIQRNNVGFDGGAYKDVFMNLSEEDLEKWDEILMVNDTIYGPFFPLKNVFEIMEGINCDFWGLSRHPGGYSGLFGCRKIAAHVQSYFIVMKKKMFMHPLFYKFWLEMPYPTSFKEAVLNFEIHFSEYFSGIGFRFASWMDVQSEKNGICSGAVDETIIKLHFPVLKRKSYSLWDYIRFKKLFVYLEENIKYPVDAIYEDINYRSEMGLLYPYNPLKLLNFCSIYKRIYLYGMGKYAKNLECYLNDNGIAVTGYLVTKADSVSENVFAFAEFLIEPDIGIVVALNEKNFREVYAELKKRVSINQMILPEYV